MTRSNWQAVAVWWQSRAHHPEKENRRCRTPLGQQAQCIKWHLVAGWCWRGGAILWLRRSKACARAWPSGKEWRTGQAAGAIVLE